MKLRCQEPEIQSLTTTLLLPTYELVLRKIKKKFSKQENRDIVFADSLIDGTQRPRIDLN